MSRPRWIALAAALALAAGVGTAWHEWRAGQPRAPRAAAPALPDPGDTVIDQALAQARDGARADSAAVDSAVIKSKWVGEIKGFVYADLSPARRQRFIRFANAERCTCGCGYTLAGCRAYDPTCPVSGPRVQALLDSIRR
jgi:hypothetical protein